MNYSGFSVRNVQSVFAAIAIFAMVFSPFANVQLAQAHHDPFGGVPQTSVKICHINGNGSYIVNSPSISATGGNISISGGHADHGNQHGTDIIPPFHFNDNGNILSYPGKNWNPSTEDIWASGDCTGNGTAISISALPVLQCGPQNMNISGTVVFQANTAADSLVIKLDGVIVVDDENIDADPDAVSEPWSYVLNNVGVGSHTIEAIVYDNDTANTGVKASDTESFTINACPVLPLLTLVKEVSGGPSAVADWTLSADGATDISGVTGASAVTDAVVTAGTYTLSESGPTPAQGSYTASTWSCPGTTVTNGNEITLANGDDITCTITNTYVPPAKITFTVVKELVQDNGGTDAVDDFSFNLNSTEYGFDEDGSVAVVLDAGTYSVTEVMSELVDGRYDVSYSAGCNPGYLAPGASTVCTITNNDIAPELTVIKHVENDNIHKKGTAAASDFLMNVAGTNVSSTSFAGSETGVTVTLDAGDFEVTEGAHAGYADTYSAHCEGTIDLGEALTCTVTNNDLSPTSVVVSFLKTIVDAFDNDTKLVTDFSFSLSNAIGTFISGDSVELTAGTYTVTENAPEDEGYDVEFAGACEGGSITIAEGDYGTEVECEVINTELSQCSNGIDDDNDGFTDFDGQDVGCKDGDDDSETDPVSTITIDKTVTGEDASDTEPFDFEITLEGDEVFGDEFILAGTTTPKVFNNLKPGTYTVAEYEDLARWELTDVTCMDGDVEESVFWNENSVDIIITPGKTENITCVFTNEYTPRDSGGNNETIIVTKEITPGSDTGETFSFTVEAEDFDLSFDLSDGLSKDIGEGDLAADTVYTITETDLPSGWNLEDISCESDQESEDEIAKLALVALPLNSYQVYLNDGETITCTFTNDQERYDVTGQVWNDLDEDGVIDEGEEVLPGWLVRATNASNTEEFYTDETDPEGFYLFNLPEGTWIISEVVESGWGQTFPEGDGTHTVVLPDDAFVFESESAFLDSFVEFFISTAHAATVGQVSGKNFGNILRPTYSQGSYGGGNGTRISLRDNDDEPEGEVLGEATSTLPVGAPNTGAGGSATTIPSFTAVLVTAAAVRRK